MKNKKKWGKNSKQKVLGREKPTIFDKIRTFSKNNFDFLTSRFGFHADVPVWGVIRMQFPTFLNFQNFHTTNFDSDLIFWRSIVPL